MTLATLRSAARPVARLLLPVLTTLPFVYAQTPAVTLPAGTPLVLKTPRNLPMRAGLPFSAELLYPVYADNHIVIPEKSVLNGAIVSLRPDSSRRTRARLGGDFTPFHIPVVHFTELVLPDGAHVPIETGASTDGAPIFRAVAPPPVKGSFVHRQIDAGLTVVRSNVAIFNAPGKGDRALQFVYNRLPYHPERVEKTTAWTTKAETAISLPAQPAPPPIVASDPPPHRQHWWDQPAPVVPPSDTETGRWTVQAYLDQPLSSETAKPGQSISATVAAPIFNPDGTIAIPQGASLVGTVAKAQPARFFGRTGTLSFNFRELTLPGGVPQNVETTLTGADSAAGLALNSEGQVKSKPRDRVSVPLILAIIASRPLDRGDGGVQESGVGRNAAAGAAGLGLVGTIIGLSGASPNAAAGIGYYGAALSVYDRWIARGKKVIFPQNTRIVVQTVARRSAPIHADPSRSESVPSPNH